MTPEAWTLVAPRPGKTACRTAGVAPKIDALHEGTLRTSLTSCARTDGRHRVRETRAPTQKMVTKESMIPQKLKGQFRPKSDWHVLPLPCSAVYPPRTTWCTFHHILFTMMQRDGTLLVELKVVKNMFGENSRVSLLWRFQV